MDYTKNELALIDLISNINKYFDYIGEDDDLIPFPRYEIRERLDKYVSQNRPLGLCVHPNRL